MIALPGQAGLVGAAARPKPYPLRRPIVSRLLKLSTLKIFLKLLSLKEVKSANYDFAKTDPWQLVGYHPIIIP